MSLSRRGAATSGDIDLLITHPKYTESNKKDGKILEKIVKILKEKNYLTDDISFGNVKYMGMCQLVRTFGVF